MKHPFYIWLIAILLVSFGTDVTHAAELINTNRQNGSFEFGLKGWTPVADLSPKDKVISNPHDNNDSDKPTATEGKKYLQLAVRSKKKMTRVASRIDNSLIRKHSTSIHYGRYFTLSLDIAGQGKTPFDKAIVTMVFKNINTQNQDGMIGTQSFGIFSIKNNQWQTWQSKSILAPKGWTRGHVSLQISVFKDNPTPWRTYRARLDNVVLVQSRRPLRVTK